MPVFLDTNVLVYAYDRADPVRRELARAALTRQPASDLVISGQVLGEFFTVVTRRLAHPLDVPTAQRAVESLSALKVVPIDAGVVWRGIEVSMAAQLSYWDGLIVAAAQVAGCDRILTEDLNAGARLGAVVVENPFAGSAASP